MRIVVTGAGGFLGGVLAERLATDGHKVIAIDRAGTIPIHQNVKALRFDVRDSWQQVPAADQVYHLACTASPPAYLREPIDTLTTSAHGTRNALEFASRNGARLLFASTSEVYGDPTVHPQPEDYWGNVNPIGERSCYDEGKRYGEALCAAYARQHSTEVRIARIFNTYGPTMRPDDGRVVSSFVQAAIDGQPLPINGDGSQTRSFCYVDDTIEGLVSLMASNVPTPCNLGNPQEVQVRTLAQMVNHLTGNAAGVRHAPAMADDPTRRRPDISLARESLIWSPTVELLDGLRVVVDAYREAPERTEPGAPARDDGPYWRADESSISGR